MSKNLKKEDIFTLCVNLTTEVLKANLLTICKGEPEVLQDVPARILQTWALSAGVPASVFSFKNAEHLSALIFKLETSRPRGRGDSKKVKAVIYLLEGLEKLKKSAED